MDDILSLPQGTIMNKVVTTGEEFGTPIRDTDSSNKSVNSDSGYSDCASDQIVESLLDQKQILQSRVLHLTVENKKLISEVSNLRYKLYHQTRQQQMIATGKPIVNLEPDTTPLQQLQDQANNLHKTFHRLVVRMSSPSFTSGIEQVCRESKLEMLKKVKTGLDVLFEVVSNRVSSWGAGQKALKYELDSAQVLLEKLENDLKSDGSVSNEKMGGAVVSPSAQIQAVNIAKNGVPLRKRKCIDIVAPATPKRYRSGKKEFKSILENLLRDGSDPKENNTTNTSELNPIRIDQSLLKIPPLPSLNFPLGSLPPVTSARKDYEKQNNRQTRRFTIGSNFETNQQRQNKLQ